MPPYPTIVCKECGYVNESERVYCHGCGSKLDRALLIAQQEQETVSAEKRHRELKKMMTPGGTFFQRGGRMFLRSVGWAVLVAALIDIALPPAGVPAMPKRGELSDYQQLDLTLERMVAGPAAQATALSEADINAYLKGKGRYNKVPSWITGLVPLTRTFVNLNDGVGRLTLQADIAGYPLYIGLAARLKTDKDAGLSAVCEGGNIGRVQIPAMVARYAGVAIPIVMASFKHERELLGQLESIEIAKGQVTLRSRGTAPATPSTPTTPKPAGH